MQASHSFARTHLSRNKLEPCNPQHWQQHHIIRGKPVKTTVVMVIQKGVD